MTELLRPGFWALSQDDPAIWCPLGPQACLGGSRFNESMVSCAPGFHGPLCGVAENGAVVDSIALSTTTCSATSTAVPVVLSIISMFLLLYVSIWRKPSTNVEYNDDDDEEKIITINPSADNFFSKIILLYLSLQICSTLPAIFQVPFPSSSTTAMQLAAAFSLASPQFFGWQCLSQLLPSMSQLDHFELMQLAVALPAAAFLLLTTIVLGMHEALEVEKDKLSVRSLRSNKRRLELPRTIHRQEVLWTRYTRAVTALYLIPLFGILNLTVSTFLCVDLSPEGDDDLLMLYDQPNMSCSGSGYDTARAWAVIALFVYAFLIPLLVVGYVKSWTGLTTCWRWLTCSRVMINDDEDVDVEEGLTVDDENLPPPPDMPPPTLPADNASLHLFLFTFVLRFLFAVILPLLPASSQRLHDYGMLYDQRPTLPRALIAVSVLTVSLGSFTKFSVHIDSQQKMMIETFLVQLILLSLAAVVLCIWPSFVDSLSLDVAVLLTLLCSPVLIILESLAPQIYQWICATKKSTPREKNGKRKINYFAVRRLFMMAHGLSDTEGSPEEEADDQGDDDEEKATSPYEDAKGKSRLLAIKDTEESDTFTGPSKTTATSSWDMESVPSPPPTSSPPPTTATAAASIKKRHHNRRVRQRPPPFPYGAADPITDDGSSGGSWRWLAADDYGLDYDHDFYQYVYDEESGSAYPGHYPDYYYPRPYYPPLMQQQLPPRSPPRLTPPRHNHGPRHSPSSYYSRGSRHSSPQTSLSSMSSRSSSCPTCEQHHHRTNSSACVQLDDVYGEYTPRYLNYHSRHADLPGQRKLNNVGHDGTKKSSRSRGSKRSHDSYNGEKSIPTSRSLIELSSDSDKEFMKEVVDGFRYEDAFDLSPLKARKEQAPTVPKEKEEAKAFKEDGEDDEEEEEEIIKRPWWHPVFLADAY